MQVQIFAQTYLPGFPETRPKAKKSARQVSFIVPFDGVSVASSEGLVIRYVNPPVLYKFET